MPGIFLGFMLAAEDMPQVGAAGGAGYFGAPAIGVRHFFDPAGDGVIETGPAAAGIEFAIGFE
jgi:hypothetical protein